MSAKKSPTGKGEDSQKSSYAATKKGSHNSGLSASQEDPKQKIKRPRSGTQMAIVLETLENAGGRWVGVDVIMRKARCAATHSAISALRSRYDFHIENRQTRSERGTVLSEYRLKAV